MKNTKSLLPTLITAIIVMTTCLATHIQHKMRPTLTLFIHGSKPQLHSAFYKIGQYYFLPDMHHVNEQMPYAGPRAIIDGLNDSEYIDMQHLYFFGWSGRISAKERLKTATERLVPQLEKLVATYRSTYGSTPAMRIITHSHGGNVALNMLHALEQKESDIIIDELIILAAPVQSWTKEYIKSNNCKKIYSLFSADDWIQVIDPQGLQVHINKDQVKDKPALFELSKRTFEHHDTLTQARIIINNKDPEHVAFIDVLYPKQLRYLLPHQFPRFLPELGTIMQKIKHADIQKHISSTQQPVCIRIDTRKQAADERIQVFI